MRPRVNLFLFESLDFGAIVHENCLVATDFGSDFICFRVGCSFAIKALPT